MAIVATEIELQTNADDRVLRLTNIERFEDGSGYRCELTVRSGGFGYSGPFYFDDDSLANALTALRTMDKGSPGEATISFRYEYDFLRLTMNRLGHVVVSGEVNQYSESQMLKFSFRTDQTVLSRLIRDLSGIRTAGEQ